MYRLRCGRRGDAIQQRRRTIIFVRRYSLHTVPLKSIHALAPFLLKIASLPVIRIMAQPFVARQFAAIRRNLLPRLVFVRK
jgi:hypothetical protein